MKSAVFTAPTTIAGASTPSGAKTTPHVPPGGFQRTYYDPRIEHLRVEVYEDGVKPPKVTMVPISRVQSWEPA